MTTTTQRPHGSNAKYVFDKCRCTDCHAANRREANHRNRQIAYGRWQPYVDAQPVREHVQTLLDAGLGWHRVADLAGVSRGTVEKLLYGARYRGLTPSKRIRPENADKLLAVKATPDAKADGALTDGTGTRRRLQALVRAGWPQSRLAAELGMDRTNFNKTINTDRVRVSTATATRTVYDRLWRQDPREHAVSNNTWSRTVNLAKAKGWAPVGCWDDDTIDNPEAIPDWTGYCGTPKGYWTHYNLGVKPVCEPCRAARSGDRAA